MRVRRANIADVPSLMKLERQSPQAAAHWSREQYEQLFLAATHQPPNHPADHQAQSEVFAWIVENEATDPEKVSSETGLPLAFLVARRVDADCELENMVVARSARRRGIATLLLRELIAEAAAKGVVRMFLEVRESNLSARALYEKVGFEKIGLRKSYYTAPSEDAILYRLSCN